MLVSGVVRVTVKLSVDDRDDRVWVSEYTTVPLPTANPTASFRSRGWLGEWCSVQLRRYGMVPVCYLGVSSTVRGACSSLDDRREIHTSKFRKLLYFPYYKR